MQAQIDHRMITINDPSPVKDVRKRTVAKKLSAVKKKVEDLEVKLELKQEDVGRLVKTWPWADDSVDEAMFVKVIEYLTPDERIHFVNELQRVMKKGGKAQLMFPHWSSSQAYADLSYVMPPIVEGWFYHLNKDWRTANNPLESRYDCDFDTTWGYSLHPLIQPKNQEYQQHAVTFWKEAAQGVCATLTKK
jgi:SAM-dependent methyltransferase